jgi:hypothetical protein
MLPRAYSDRKLRVGSKNYMRMARCPLISALAGASCALGFVGCGAGDGLPRQSIAGQVLLDGRRLEKGAISFYPSERILHGSLVTAGAAIDNGYFEISRETGLTPGTYRVAINSADDKKDKSEKEKKTKKAEQESDGVSELPRELIPTKYNSNTVLKVEIKNRAIKAMRIAITSQ